MMKLLQGMAACASIGAIFLAPAALGDDDLGFHSGAITAQAIDSYVAAKKYKGNKSPLVGSGNSFLQAGQTYDIDPALIVAISGIETDFALRTCATDNAWNWFWQGPCPQSPFTSYDDGIQTVSKHLRLSYIDKGYNTIALIQKRYCTAPVQGGVTCPGWISGVNLFRNQLLGVAPNPTPTPPTPPPSGGGEPDTPTGQESATSKYLWIAGACVILAAGTGWLVGRRRRTS
jgi:hypothetical protein